MRRRSRRAPNTSESTGKIGQEIPSNQPAPLVPFYPDDVPRGQQPAPRTSEARQEAAPSAARPESRHEARQDARPAPRQHARPEVRSDVERGQQPAKASPPPRQQASRQDWDQPEESGRVELETQPESPGLPPAEASADRSPQTPKGHVVLAIGLPGSGKTTWFRRRGVTPLSSDLLRNILFDDVEEQRYQGLVFSTLRSLLRARLIARMPLNYVDATNLSIHERRQWIKMAKSFGYEVQAVFFDVPLEVCLQRNSQRDRSVSEDVMRKMAEKLKPPVFEEGFEKITVVRVKSTA
jgi:predicted kinase